MKQTHIVSMNTYVGCQCVHYNIDRTPMLFCFVMLVECFWCIAPIHGGVTRVRSMTRSEWNTSIAMRFCFKFSDVLHFLSDFNRIAVRNQNKISLDRSRSYEYFLCNWDSYKWTKSTMLNVKVFDSFHYYKMMQINQSCLPKFNSFTDGQNSNLFLLKAISKQIKRFSRKCLMLLAEILWRSIEQKWFLSTWFHAHLTSVAMLYSNRTYAVGARDTNTTTFARTWDGIDFDIRNKHLGEKCRRRSNFDFFFLDVLYL